MSKLEIEIKDENFSVENILLSFYEKFAPGEEKERIIHFHECVGRMKGANVLMEQYVKFVLDDLLWAVTYWVHTNSDKVIVKEATEPEPDTNTTTVTTVIDDNDQMFR